MQNIYKWRTQKKGTVKEMKSNKKNYRKKMKFQLLHVNKQWISMEKKNDKNNAEVKSIVINEK